MWSCCCCEMQKSSLALLWDSTLLIEGVVTTVVTVATRSAHFFLTVWKGLAPSQLEGITSPKSPLPTKLQFTTTIQHDPWRSRVLRGAGSERLQKVVDSYDLTFWVAILTTMHTGSWAMVARVLRVRYYWPTVKEDCDKYVRKCVQCQQHGNMIHLKSEELHGITFPWSFTIYYFTKWIEVEPLATIMT